MDEHLFAKQKHKQQPQVGPQLTTLATRLKLTEERYNNLQKRHHLTEESLLSFEREIKTDLRVMTKQLVQVRQKVSEINTKVDMMLGELANVVQKHEFKVLENYLNLWQPMQFVTRDEAKRLIDDARRKHA